ncbi:MAG: response regulator transcription factor [Niastella sp.]|nr:response regulator transcription factor [Niastella sp.]
MQYPPATAKKQYLYMTRIGIVDDKMINRKTVQRNLQGAADIRIVLEASSGQDFIEKMEHLTEAERPQIVLMDIDMPQMSGIEAIAIGTIRFPGTRFLVLTIFDDDEKIFEAIQAGASGYLLKDDSAVQLAEAITHIMEFNGTPMSPAVARKTLSWLRELQHKPGAAATSPVTSDKLLSNRELEIMKLMVEGLEYKSIAARLSISPNTVRAHISKIYEKLHINSKAQAVQLAYKYKWV